MIDIDTIRSMERPELHRISGFQSKPLVPGPFDVICARGKQAYNHQGNRYFRQIIHHATEKYSKVESKLQRSMIVTDIVDAIRAKGNGFLRKNSKGEWVECSDVMCREKVGQHFRNALGSRYKSSTKSKRRIKEESIPRLVNSLHKIVFSSKAVTDITERLEMDIIFIDETNDDEFYEKAFEANMNLLDTFKNDTSLVQQFQNQFSLGQQPDLLPGRNQPVSYGNAAA
eukprot:CAMPEP_0116129438 /NCGR_PEP_ID=MMETSP0329-20121206/7924_1 /TAXON_ID=697910 /ORGANISM="Pseudo-nitzschia arenysensis, Strain B593" /LENGTH=227 /DNA_ID=CAMNT_0003623705 /DNA_START=80 /DNA_END=763 /DNA_ORIENTATION=+